MARDYNDFPQQYFDILEKLEEHGEPHKVQLRLGYAQSIRRDFYRFQAALKRSNDDMARQLSDFATNVKVSVRPGRGRYDDPAEITFYIIPDLITPEKPVTKRKKKHSAKTSTTELEDLDLESLEQLIESRKGD